MDEKMTRLEQTLQYTFTDKKLLETAMTHSSYAHEYINEGKQLAYNERLEFLGDAVLELEISRMLYTTMDVQEGDLSRRRAQIVCEQSLSYVARQMKLGQYLRLSRGEEKSGGKRKDSLLSDFVEALIGAVYLDGGYEEAKRLIQREIVGRIDEIDRKGPIDYKTLLQEKVQASGREAPVYHLYSMSGPPHDRRFTMEAVVEGQVMGLGTGRTKKAAEQMAAEAALKEHTWS